MTKPTQANLGTTANTSGPVTLPAAIAAAGVAPQMDIEDCDGDLAEIEQIAESRANIAAAAEVGKEEIDARADLIHDYYDEKFKKQQAELIIATIERCAQVTKEYIESLLDPKSETMSHWDQIRAQCENYKGSDLPRLNFESLIETIAEDAAAAIRALKDKP